MASIVTASSLEKGEKAQAKWKYGNKWFNVTVDIVNDDGTYGLSYEDGDTWDAVPPSKIRGLDGISLDPTGALLDETKNKEKKNSKLIKSGKWAILRRAILSTSKGSEDTENAEEASIHRHDGFHMFEKVNETENSILLGHEAPCQSDLDQGYHVICYQIHDESVKRPIDLRILERRAGAKLSLSEIAPGKYGHGEGVDNTGNVRVWPAEEILLHTVLSGLKRAVLTSSGNSSEEISSFPCLFSPEFVRHGNKKLLELGGGMTALAGLGLAASKLKASYDKTCLFNQVVVTDGNPSSVAKQTSNLALNSHLTQEVCMASHVLFWEPNDESGTERNMLEALKGKESSAKSKLSMADASSSSPKPDSDNLGNSFDLIIGADLLFFESHGALASCLDRLLTHHSHSMVILCQPSRGGTMEKFAQHPEVTAKFNVLSYDTSSFDPVVARLHESYLSDPTYDPSIHSPSLLCLSRRL